jgi:hypothetical protein
MDKACAERAHEGQERQGAPVRLPNANRVLGNAVEGKFSSSVEHIAARFIKLSQGVLAAQID